MELICQCAISQTTQRKVRDLENWTVYFSICSLCHYSNSSCHQCLSVLRGPKLEKVSHIKMSAYPLCTEWNPGLMHRNQYLHSYSVSVSVIYPSLCSKPKLPFFLR